MINPLVVDLAAHTSTVEACRLLGRSRAGHYRSLRPPAPAVERRPRPAPCNALTQAERAHVLAVLASERFVDKSVAQVWATLLDEGTYPCSMSTMHRILRANHAAGERRSQATHPPRTVPELLAKPGQVWSWDITKLRGPTRGVYYDLHVVLDIFSRFVVAWTVAAREDATIATEMLAQAMGVHGIPDVVHADRGTSMTSKPDAQLPVDLGVTRSHSRPRVSNDNPYNEAAFKTLEYTPVFPENFGSLADARAFGEKFFGYDNHKHRHSGIGLHTPASVHYGTARDVRALRQATLDAAYQARPERFGHHRPEPPILPTEAWINQPS